MKEVEISENTYPCKFTSLARNSLTEHRQMGCGVQKFWDRTESRILLLPGQCCRSQWNRQANVETAFPLEPETVWECRLVVNLGRAQSPVIEKSIYN